MLKPVIFNLRSQVHEFINADKSYTITLIIEPDREYVLTLDWEAALNLENVQIAISQLFDIALDTKQK